MTYADLHGSDLAAAWLLLAVPIRASALGAGVALLDLYLAPPAVTSLILMLGFALGVAGLWGRWRAGPPPRFSGWRRVAVPAVAAAILIAGIGIAGEANRPPDTYGVMDHGTADFGGGPATHHMADRGTSVADLAGPRTGRPARQFTLTARKARVRVPSGGTIDAWTFNGRLPGPELRVRQGELVEVTVVNRDIEDGVTLHWHGVDVPNREDGVAGVTQDAVMPGQSYTYRFRPEQVGTFWYHSHQLSSEQVEKGLYGAFVILPREPDWGTLDLVTIAHDFGDEKLLGDRAGMQRRTVAPGTPVRLRLVNSNDTNQRFTLTGTPYRVAAIDGTDLNRPGPLEGRTLELGGGGRYDLTFTMPDRAVQLDALTVAANLVLAPGTGDDGPRRERGPTFDPLEYGAPARTPFGASSRFDREFEMDIEQRLGFSDRGFGYQWSINGKIYPDTPMYMVREGDLVKMTILNRSGAVHPIHLHGHRALVLSRDGRAARSPWWSDTLNVAPGERYEIAFRADNPGVWMDHCHNLTHAARSFVVHLAYEGVTTPFKLGDGTRNRPE
jgi:FtsP/CotA-like multicopper oxidase with cupredoxin domain